jgi:hypothetical protein
MARPDQYPRIQAASLQVVRFRYVNWRNEDHLYEVDVESFQFGPYAKGGFDPGAPHVWVMNAHVVKRDDTIRVNPGGTRRTFLVSDIRDLEIVSE